VDSNGSNGFGNRLFWTAAIPGSDVQVQLGAGKAAMHVSSLATLDYPNLPISVGAQWQTSFVPATISFDVVWNSPVTQRINIRNGTNGNQFAGQFLENEATVSWSARNASGFSFRSNVGDFSTSVKRFAELGQERNGSFFQPDSPAAPGVTARSSTLLEAALATQGVQQDNPALPGVLISGSKNPATGDITLAERFEQPNWSAAPIPSVRSALNGVARNDVWTVGDESVAKSLTLSFEHWDGTSGLDLTHD
jgi:hypothetical protein